MIPTLAVAAGGAVGSVLRYWAGLGAHHLLGRGFPYGTLTVNIIGSFAIGVLYVLLVERASTPELRALLMTGLLGGFTTFSAFSIETVLLLEQGALLKALANIVLSLTLCLGCTLLGLAIGRQVL